MEPLRPVPTGDDAPDVPTPGAGAPDLAELLRLSARGDRDAFAQVYDALSPRIYGLVLRVIRNPSLAEEVSQEVFLEIWRQSARFDANRGSAASWAMTIAHRKAVDRVRSEEASTRRNTAYEQRNQGVEHDQTADAAHASIDAQRVRGALADLTEVQRQALELSYFGGYTHSEVASMLDLPLGTAKTRIRDGLIRLRDKMGVGA